MPADRIAPVALAVAAWIATGMPAAAQPPMGADAAVAVAAQAVRDAFGGDADVEISAPVLSLVRDAAPIARAVPEPSSRTGGPVRFVLWADGAPVARRVGRLTATVRVVAPLVRARQPIAAGTVLSPELVEAVRADVGRQRLAPLPALAQVAAATTRHAVRAGDVLTPVSLVTRALVASGDEVTTVVRIGTLEVRGRAIAAQSGDLGETVIVVNPDSRRRLRARVVAEDVVEVQHGT